MRESREPRSLEPRSLEEWARLEREAEPLVRIVADAHERRLDPNDPHTARYYDWLARELRARERPEERLSPEQLARIRDRIQARIHADRLQVARGGAAPRVREAATRSWDARGGGGGGSGAGLAAWAELPVAAGAGREIWDEPCERWVEVPLALPRGEYVALTVQGDSMTPLLHAGDVILVRRGGEVARGRVIVARHPDDGYVVKEVGRVGRRAIELRSLNPEYPPVTIPRMSALIAGTVVLRWCAHDERG
jgi:hypothetical protein